MDLVWIYFVGEIISCRFRFHQSPFHCPACRKYNAWLASVSFIDRILEISRRGKPKRLELMMMIYGEHCQLNQLFFVVCSFEFDAIMGQDINDIGHVFFDYHLFIKDFNQVLKLWLFIPNLINKIHNHTRCYPKREARKGAMCCHA